MMHQETICAPATAPGGAIGLIRVSGPEAVTLTDKIFTPQKGRPLAGRKAYSLTFGHIASEDGEIIDEVLVSLFRAPHSYTGEDSTEISCHGSPYIMQRILDRLTATGCRMAAPGEYTQRAFLNGKMDLSQAEAVADLIASTSAATHRMAMNQMRGRFSDELHHLRERLLHITSLVELELDFSDHEDLEFADRTELQQLVEETEAHISRLLDSFRLGNALKQGIPVAIIGETNAGKSTLLNRLLGEERAIVSHVHGTTRDVIEDVVNIDGIPFRFIDTAGIRDTADEVESIGIRRTFEKLKHAEIVLWLIDATAAKEQYARLAPRLLPLCADKRLLILLNKSDLQPGMASPSIPIDTHSIALASPTTIDDTSTTSLATPSIPIDTSTTADDTSTTSLATPSIPIDTSTTADDTSTMAIDTSTTALTTTTVDGTSSAISGPPPTPSDKAKYTILPLSAKTGKGLETLRAALLTNLPSTAQLSSTTVIVTNTRHAESLRAAHAALLRVRAALAQGLPGDLLAQDLRECLHHLSAIVGEISTPDILKNIFRNFCIGK